MENFFSMKLTWGNVGQYEPRLLKLPPSAHISTIFVQAGAVFKKMPTKRPSSAGYPPSVEHGAIGGPLRGTRLPRAPASAGRFRPWVTGRLRGQPRGLP